MKENGLCSYLHQSKLEEALHFIQNGVDINERQDFEVLPIIAAINSDDPKTLDFVIKHGANLNIENGHPLTEVIDLIIDSMVQEGRLEPFPETMDMLEILLRNGANPEIQK